MQLAPCAVSRCSTRASCGLLVRLQISVKYLEMSVERQMLEARAVRYNIFRCMYLRDMLGW